MHTEKIAVVLGAYGLIGTACLHALRSAGFRVIGVGRSMTSARQCAPDIPWLTRDIAITDAETWRHDLAGAHVVVNASGALQDGLRDTLHDIHDTALANLVDALSGSKTRFVQISAAGVSEHATTEFMRSKMRGDQHLMKSGLDWITLRPTLVLSPHAYGGTALLRASAAFPFAGLQILPDTLVQTVHVDDVAEAVVQAAQGDITPRTVADLTETQAHSFQDVIEQVRHWQGFPAWTRFLPIPQPVVRMTGRIADGLGWLGWRSPLRTTALRALEAG